MKSKITRREMNVLNKIDAIDARKEACKIIENPSKYFSTYFDKIKNPVAIIFANLSVIAVLRKLDSSDEICEITFDHFSEKYSLNDWLSKLNDFYLYIISRIDYVLENHDNAILDSFNEGHIDKKIMNQGMKSFVGVRKRMTEDKEILKTCLKDLESERDRAEEIDEDNIDLED